jgi:AmmeMemoRadiSam system protein A/AmmeMemoRadiSam system protein B
MAARSSLVYVGVAPHPPIMVAEVGGDAVREVAGSIEAMREMSERVIKSGAQTIIIISPHAPLEAQAFVAYRDAELRGSFAPFRAPEATVSAPLDAELLDAIERESSAEGFEIASLEGYGLDHGTAVPLYFLLRNGWRGSLVALGYSFLSDEDHVRFGASLRRAADAAGRPVAFIASGDLSHRLTLDAPAGYNPNAHLFDEQVTASIRDREPARIAGIDPQLRRLAGECGYRSLLVAVGASQGLHADCELLNYEAPFGVGYLVAQLARATDDGETASDAKNEMGRRNVDQIVSDQQISDQTSRTQDSRRVTSETSAEESDSETSADDAGDSLPALARRAVESYVRGGLLLHAADAPDAPLLNQHAACFVSIKTDGGELRGCIGTIEPQRDTLAEELIANAVSAATRDPRFPPVSVDELSRLRYSVDILSEPEPASFEDLDPNRYGVIVEDEAGVRRGLLLPDIEGVETAAQQVQIASRKAGIAADEHIKLYRFRVDRFPESSSSQERTE